MTTYSSNVFTGEMPAATAITLFTVPATEVFVVRDMEYFLGAGSLLFNVQVSTPGGTGLIWYLTTTASPSWHQWQGRVVLPPGGKLLGYDGSGGGLLTVSGYRLSAP